MDGSPDIFAHGMVSFGECFPAGCDAVKSTRLNQCILVKPLVQSQRLAPAKNLVGRGLFWKVPIACSCELTSQHMSASHGNCCGSLLCKFYMSGRSGLQLPSKLAGKGGIKDGQPLPSDVPMEHEECG